MPPDDDSYRQLQKYRSREILLGAILGCLALGSTVLYWVLLRGRLALPILIMMMVSEWLVMGVVYLIIVSKMRSRR